MNVRVQYTAKFLAGIFYDGHLQMNEYVAKIYMMTATEDPADHNVALNRIKQFIYGELENTIFIDEEDSEHCEKLVNAGLSITTMPSEPVDQVIGIMLYSKLTAITEGRLLIGEIELSSALGEGIVYLHGENENVSDVTPPEWWSTCDLVHSNIPVTDKVLSIHKGSVWRELDLGWPDNEDIIIEYSPEEEESGNTIVFANFRKSDDTK